ncbi:14595_t:CDS:2 [Acaulospora morrowiae]|uniref:14595_t:CDS:1 n=1 Tax=Acaulospora morrowiae TaxID=94023 RepID=A0A9N9BQS1_9GLOM|nr:14595_t:CDS:2 [Acaulospora morrowiae]
MTGSIFKIRVTAQEIYHGLKALWFNKSSYCYHLPLRFWDRLVITFLKITALIFYYSNWKFEENQDTQLKLLSIGMSVEEFKEKFLVLRNDERKIWKNTTVAVVVPIYLTSKTSLSQTRAMLECLATQTILPVVVVVIDDASPFEYKFDEICPSTFITIMYEKLKVKVGLSSARSHGIKIAFEADPSLIMFTEMNCRPCESWIESAIEHFEKNRKERGCCMILSGLTSPLGETYFDLYHFIFGTSNGLYVPSDKSLLYGLTCNLCVPVQILNAINFDEDFKDGVFGDVEFCIRARKLFDAKPWLVERMRVHYDFAYLPPDMGLWKPFTHSIENYVMFCLQFRKYGEWEPLLLAKHNEYSSWKSGLHAIHLK